MPTRESPVHTSSHPRRLSSAVDSFRIERIQQSGTPQVHPKGVIRLIADRFGVQTLTCRRWPEAQHRASFVRYVGSALASSVPAPPEPAFYASFRRVGCAIWREPVYRFSVSRNGILV